MGNTTIEWCDRTLNPGIYGCSPTSPGCRSCYAAKMAHRQTAMGNYPEGITHKTANGVKWTGEVIVDQSAITREFAKLPKQAHKKVFVTSMADLFHPDVPFWFVQEVYLKMFLHNHLTFMVLTKHPHRLQNFLNVWLPLEDGCGWRQDAFGNIWHGFTAENQKYFDERWYYMKDVQSVKTFVSCEPLLSSITLPDDFLVLGSDAQVFVGGETGSNSRPMYPELPQFLRNQCENAGIDFLFKAWGDYDPHPAKRKQWINCGWSKNNKRHGSTLL